MPAIFSSIKFWIITIASLAMGLIIFLGYTHYTNLLEQNKQLANDNSTLRVAVDTQSKTVDKAIETIENWDNTAKRFESAVIEMQEINYQSKEQSRRIDEILAKHNLAALSLKKPGLIENRINAGTTDAQRLLRCASGAKDPNCNTKSKATDKAVVTKP